MLSEKTRAYISISFVNVLWGLSFIASKLALENGFQPFSLAFVRFALASVILAPIYFKKKGDFALPRADFFKIFMSAVLGITLYFLFEYKGLQNTSASTASLIIASIPALTLFVGRALRHRKYPAICYMGSVLSLVGVYIIVRYSSGEGSDTLIGNIYIICACFCWVGFIELADGLMRKHTSLYVTFWQTVIATVTLIPCAMTEPIDWAAVAPIGWIMAVYLSVLCSVVAYLLYNQTIKVLEPFKAALFININPLSAVIGGVLLLGETMMPMQILGGAIVLISIFIVNRRSV
ncbi:MAG: DMT family transporter [Clostridia bacterium]|nr:DMT family transporter [Clostridia bacterium]